MKAVIEHFRVRVNVYAWLRFRRYSAQTHRHREQSNISEKGVETVERMRHEKPFFGSSRRRDAIEEGSLDRAGENVIVNVL